jgi:hypothetical protein
MGGFAVTKIVYNACYGGFSLSDAAIRRYAEIKGLDLVAIQNGYSLDWQTAAGEYFSSRDIPRDDKALVQVVEEMQEAANGLCADLAIEDVPSSTLYRIDEYDGMESVMTQADYDWKVA